MDSTNAKILTKDNFEAEVLNSSVPVLVDFWAPWCGPCRMVSPVIDQIADEFLNKAAVFKVNVDEQGELAMKFEVVSIPTIILFKNGQIVERLTGAYPKTQYTALLEKAL